MLCIHNTKCYRRLPNNYACLQALVNNVLTWQGSCVIANNARKTARLFVQGYNLDIIEYRQVHDVIEYRQVIISHASQVLCDIVSRSRYRLSSPSVRFAPC